MSKLKALSANKVKLMFEKWLAKNGQWQSAVAASMLFYGGDTPIVWNKLTGGADLKQDSAEELAQEFAEDGLTDNEADVKELYKLYEEFENFGGWEFTKNAVLKVFESKHKHSLLSTLSLDIAKFLIANKLDTDYVYKTLKSNEKSYPSNLKGEVKTAMSAAENTSATASFVSESLYEYETLVDNILQG